MGFPLPYGGFFPRVVLLFAMSIVAIREFFGELLHLAGLYHKADNTEDLWQFTTHVELNSQNKIHTLGITPEAVRESLPSVVFEMLEQQHPQGDCECAVCLCDFHEGQEVRQLPCCWHVFHKDCIDRWLDHDQNSCPLCRSSLLTEQALTNKANMQAEQINSWVSPFQEDHSSILSPFSQD
eukprot:c14608_g1_i2 orf=366-908(+)